MQYTEKTSIIIILFSAVYDKKLVGNTTKYHKIHRIK